MGSEKAEIRPEELEAFLDEALPAPRMREIEEALRRDRNLAEQLRAIIQRRDLGLVSIAEVWRRQRLSCPSRDTLGAYLLGALPPDEARFVRIHLERIGCRYCLANLADLQSRMEATQEQKEAAQRRCQRYFRSSLHHLTHSAEP
ncbi:hypothetical protein [Thermogutta sp.]|uniref:hypothetical protein n=1 Tax=Thermogutta sp. TaxID=1962930 RepID=UPI00321F9EA8